MFCYNRTPSPISLFAVIVGATRCRLVSTAGHSISFTEVSSIGEARREYERVFCNLTDVMHSLTLNYTTHVDVGSGLIRVYGIPKLIKFSENYDSKYCNTRAAYKTVIEVIKKIDRAMVITQQNACDLHSVSRVP